MTDDLNHRRPGCQVSSYTAVRARAAGAALAVALAVPIAAPVQAVSFEPAESAQVVDGGGEPAVAKTLVSVQAVSRVAADVPPALDVSAPPLDGGAVDAGSLDEAFGGAPPGDGVPGTVTAAVDVSAVAAGSAGPLVGYEDPGSDDGSVFEMLHSVATVDGQAPAAGGPARANRRSRRQQALPSELREAVLELLEESVSLLGTVDGKKVFSILGAGLFTLEVARDGSGVKLSELGSGKSILFGAEGDEKRARRRPRPAEREDGAGRYESDGDVGLRGADDGFEQEGPLAALITAIAETLASIGRSVVGFASSPVLVLLLVPFVFIWFLIDSMRQRMSRDETPVAEQPVAAPDPKAVAAHSSGHRRRRRKRVRWMALFAEIRTSLGFPQADLIRESDHVLPPRRRRRRKMFIG